MATTRLECELLLDRIGAVYWHYDGLRNQQQAQGNRLGILWDQAVHREECRRLRRERRRRTSPYGDSRPQMARRTGGAIGNRHAVATMVAQGRADRVVGSRDLSR